MLRRPIITTILALAAMLCGCQDKEKHVYELPTSDRLAELERQEKAYSDSLDKYCALNDTA